MQTWRDWRESMQIKITSICSCVSSEETEEKKIFLTSNLFICSIGASQPSFVIWKKDIWTFETRIVVPQNNATSYWTNRILIIIRNRTANESTICANKDIILCIRIPNSYSSTIIISITEDEITIVNIWLIKKLYNSDSSTIAVGAFTSNKGRRRNGDGEHTGRTDSSSTLCVLRRSRSTSGKCAFFHIKMSSCFICEGNSTCSRRGLAVYPGAACERMICGCWERYLFRTRIINIRICCILDVLAIFWKINPFGVIYWLSRMKTWIEWSLM